MVRTLTGIYRVKIYQGPVCIVEDIICLEIVMGTVDTNLIKKDLKEVKNLHPI